MNKKYIFIIGLFAALLSPLDSTAQMPETEARELLQKIDDALSNVQTVVYKIDYTNKYLARRDTIHTSAICSLYIAPKDKMRAYNIVDLEFSELGRRTYGHRRYDGKRTFWANYPVDSLNVVVKPDIGNKGRINRAVVENYGDLLLKEYLTEKNPFKKYRPAAGSIGITEEMLKNTPVYVLTMTFKDTEDVRDNVEKHYIRKSDFLPVAFSSFLRWENMEQYKYYEVDYLAVNPDTPLEAFKIDEDETINAIERYKVFMEKIKI